MGPPHSSPQPETETGKPHIGLRVSASASAAARSGEANGPKLSGEEATATGAAALSTSERFSQDAEDEVGRETGRR